MFKNLPRSARIGILVGFIVLVALIIVAITSTVSNSNKKGEYYDEGSGETVSDPAGKSPESEGTSGSQPVYLGFSKLIDNGLTLKQLDLLKSALRTYSDKNKLNITEFSLSIKTIESSAPVDNSNSKQNLTFEMTTNRKQKRIVKLDYFGLTSIHLYVFENSKMAYDSGDLSVNVGAGIDDEFTGDGVPPEEQ